MKIGPAYGTVFLNQNEGFSLAKKQIDAFAKHRPLACYFDVIGRPSQQKEGEELCQKITQYAQLRLRYLGSENIFCSFSLAS